MADYNSEHNRVVWTDVHVADLDRAVAFYAGVLAIEVIKDKFGDFEFAVLAHDQGNGGCLVPDASKVSGMVGPLVYFNADGRIRDAVKKVGELGGTVIEDVHTIGPHGCRAVVMDSEGNRIALHSRTDA